MVEFLDKPTFLDLPLLASSKSLDFARLEYYSSNNIFAFVQMPHSVYSEFTSSSCCPL